MAEPAPDSEQNLLRHRAPRGLTLFLLLAATAFALLLVTGIFSRLTAAHRLRAAANAGAIPTVGIIHPQRPAAGQNLVLPGTVKAYYEAPIYAQVSGYLQSWRTDIGTPVKAGQVMAVIATPNLDQELASAQANLASAIATEQIDKITAQRWDAMRVGDAVSQQDADEKDAAYTAARAATAQARATLAGYQAQEAFKTIIAPFDGVVTARNTDIGALITTGAPTATPLFTVDDEARLRIYVDVPEADAADLRTISSANFTVPEYPGRVFTAKLVATAAAINPNSGTLLVQFQADNRDGALQPGDYAQVTLTFPASTAALTLPASALMFRDSGMAVALAGPDNRAVMKPITISRDLGNVVEIAAGLSPADRIIDNPPDSLEAGDPVQIAPEKQGHQP